MRKICKIFVSAITVLSLVLCTVPVAFAQDATAKLYNVYGDGMLFRQNSEAVLSGTGTGGAEIFCALADSDGNIIRKAKGYVNRSGEFEISFIAPEGGYKTYTITVYVNGNPFRVLNNIVFGELWLASGQSNMQYGLPEEYYIKNGTEKIGSNARWLRAALVPAVSLFNGSEEYCPADPQKDIENVRWADGTSNDFYSHISAVAYYFANKLQKDIDMPVGIINSSLGGSSINTWLSRETIENNPQIKNMLESHKAYIPYESWNPNTASQFYDMTANFDTKINALRHFSISGIIWYQGETDVINNYTPEEYTILLKALQRSYTGHFGYEDGLVPLVYSNIASYFYHNIYEVAQFNEAIAGIADKDEHRACVSIYDIGLDYTESLGAIHPAKKKPVGERMAYAAENFVYAEGDCFTAATVKESEIKDNSVYVKFNNTGKELCFEGNEIKGCAVCGENGVYVPAKAQLVSTDTVKIYSDAVSNPVSASYAYCLDNGTGNLFSSDENAKAMPVSPFVTDKAYSKFFPLEQWTECESEKAWHCDKVNGFYDTWKADNCNISFTSSGAQSGNAGLEITGKGSWNISPVRKYKDGIKKKLFLGTKTDYSDIEAITFMVRNTGEKDIVFKGAKLYTSAVSWFEPSVENGNVKATIPADSQWHKITLSLNSLYLYGNKGGAAYTNNSLDKVTDIKFCFKGSGNIYFDSVEFAPETEDKEVSFSGSFDRSDNIFEYFCALFTEVVDGFIKLIKE